MFVLTMDALLPNKAMSPWRRRGWSIAIWLLGLVGLIGLLAVVFIPLHLVSDFRVVPEIAAMVIAMVVGAIVVLATLLTGAPKGTVGLTVFAVFLICGGVLAVVRTSGAPKMEPAAVLLDGGRWVSGFYIGQTGDRIYIAPLPGSGDPGDPFADADIDRIVEFSRDKVQRLALRSPAGIKPNEAGRDQAQSLLEDLLAQQVSSPSTTEVVTTANPVAAFAPLVHLNSSEPGWPVSTDYFFRNSALVWAHAGCPDYVVALDTHLKYPERKLEQIVNQVDTDRLAKAPFYEHSSADSNCRDRTGRSYATSDRTRPFDGTRAEGLDEDEGFSLDLVNSRRAGTDKDRDPSIDKNGAQWFYTDTPAYYERHDTKVDANGQEKKDGDTKAMRITYWLFYAVSYPPGPKRATKRFVHEGDWERISVLVRTPRGRNDQDRYVPLSVRYHMHNRKRDVPWYAAKRVGTGGPDLSTHPVVFSAKGSHASYPRAGRYVEPLVRNGRVILEVHDEATACLRCPRWRTWEKLIDAETEPWYGYGGAWGSVGSSGDTTGPLGPSVYKTLGLKKPQEPQGPVIRLPVAAPEK